MTFRKVLSHCKTLKRYGSPIVHVLAGSFSSSLEKKSSSGMSRNAVGVQTLI